MTNKKRIHFIGIGGISMSGLAEIAIKNGYEVTGSDIKDSHLIDKLRDKGAVVDVPHKAELVEGASLVVFTAAVKMDNPEMQRATELGIPMMERSVYLGSLMKKYSYGIAISGTHGKTTTTSMTGIVFREAGFDPTILVGGEVSALGGNVITGASEYFITEACEYVDSFLKFYPFIGVILNIEADHLDYFRDIDHIKESFAKFAALIPEDGFLIVSADSENCMEVGKKSGKNLITFGIGPESDYRAENISSDGEGHGNYTLTFKRETLCQVSLSIPGKHNIINSLAVMSTAITAGIDPKKAAETIATFKGTSRRFEQKGIEKGITVIDEYAHHPTEIQATLEAASNLKHNHIWVVFQPHTYTRTRALFTDFSHSFTNADSVIVTDIYAAREKDPGDVSVKALADAISDNGVMCQYCGDFDVISDIISESVKDGDIVFTMGAGDITNLGPLILEKIKLRK